MGKLTMAGILALALSLSLAVPVAAGPREDATTAYQRGDYGVAFRLWRPLAEQGDARAQAALGRMYNTGEGVAQNRLQAASWYRKAADQGDFGGQLSLGLMYEHGRGVTRDYVQAYKWLNLVAAHFVPPSDMYGTLQREIAVSARDQMAAKMTPAQVAEAQRLAQDWKPQ
jgi:hypothetical protein